MLGAAFRADLRAAGFFFAAAIAGAGSGADTPSAAAPSAASVPTESEAESPGPVVLASGSSFFAGVRETGFFGLLGAAFRADLRAAGFFFAAASAGAGSGADSALGAASPGASPTAAFFGAAFRRALVGVFFAPAFDAFPLEAASPAVAASSESAAATSGPVALASESSFFAGVRETVFLDLLGAAFRADLRAAGFFFAAALAGAGSGVDSALGAASPRASSAAAFFGTAFRLALAGAFSAPACSAASATTEPAVPAPLASGSCFFVEARETVFFGLLGAAFRVDLRAAGFFFAAASTGTDCCGDPAPGAPSSGASPAATFFGTAFRLALAGAFSAPTLDDAPPAPASPATSVSSEPAVETSGSVALVEGSSFFAEAREWVFFDLLAAAFGVDLRAAGFFAAAFAGAGSGADSALGAAS